MTDDKIQTVDHFGRSLTGRLDWKSCSTRRCEQRGKEPVEDKKTFKNVDLLFRKGMGRVVYEILEDFLLKHGRTDELFAAMTFREVGLTEAQMEEISDSVGNVFSEGGFYLHYLLENKEMLDWTIGDFVARTYEYFGGMRIDVMKCHDLQKNRACVQCKEVCPVDAIMSVNNEGADRFYMINSKKCIECGACSGVCSNGAISSLEDRLNALTN